VHWLIATLYEYLSSTTVQYSVSKFGTVNVLNGRKSKQTNHWPQFAKADIENMQPESTSSHTAKQDRNKMIKAVVAPRQPRFSSTGSVGEDLKRRSKEKYADFGDLRKRSIGRSISSSEKKNATFGPRSPKRGVAKASSFQDALNRGPKRTSIADKNCEQGLKRTVSFGAEQVKTVEPVPEDMKNDIWYTERQLDTLHQIEIKKTLLAHLKLNVGKKSSSECDDCTWRGLEGLEEEAKRVERIKAYVRTVIFEYHHETPAEDLQRIAKTMSRTDRDRAHSMGLQDEIYVRPPITKIGGRQLVGRTFSGSLNWMKRSNASLMASSKKGGLATAA
jgi:hypothetical protein